MIKQLSNLLMVALIATTSGQASAVEVPDLFELIGYHYEDSEKAQELHLLNSKEQRNQIIASNFPLAEVNILTADNEEIIQMRWRNIGLYMEPILQAQSDDEWGTLLQQQPQVDETAITQENVISLARQQGLELFLKKMNNAYNPDELQQLRAFLDKELSSPKVTKNTITHSGFILIPTKILNLELQWDLSTQHTIKLIEPITTAWAETKSKQVQEAIRLKQERQQLEKIRLENVRLHKLNEAHEKEKRTLKESEDSGTIEGFSQYLLVYPEGQFVEQLINHVSRYINQLSTEERQEVYSLIYNKHPALNQKLPDSSSEYQAFITALEDEKRLFQKSIKGATLKGLTNYLAIYPNGQFVEQLVAPIQQHINNQSHEQQQGVYRYISKKYPELLQHLQPVLSATTITPETE